MVMINQIEIQNFKCFKQQIIPLASLNVFTGFNAAGKSSSIQSLLLASQIEKKQDGYDVLLNGKNTRLGTTAEVLSRNADSREIAFKFESEGSTYSITLDASIRGNLSLPASIKSTSEKIKRNFSKTVFISAARDINLDLFPIPESSSHTNADVGSVGQYAPWLFEIHKDEEIHPSKMHPRESSRSFRKQFLAWMNEIFPNAEANTTAVEGLPYVKLELRKSIHEDWNRPVNIGFGLSYVFPVLVAGLLTEEDQILIVDSPEAHLHPMGQSKIGGFLSMVAASGTQTIIETHSDHVLNGIRLAVSKQKIAPQKVNIHFFDTRLDDENIPIPFLVSPQIDKYGQLSEWPEGFFDQTDKDISEINGWD